MPKLSLTNTKDKTERLTPKAAKLKIENYCAYQERCHQEVTQKLYEYGLNTDDVNELLAHLIKNNFLNEQRYATLFAGSKVRQNKWGKIKIIQALKHKNISKTCIQKALTEIDNVLYERNMFETATKYYQTLKDKNNLLKRQKTIKHLISRGFESDRVFALAAELFDNYINI